MESDYSRASFLGRLKSMIHSKQQSSKHAHKNNTFQIMQDSSPRSKLNASELDQTVSMFPTVFSPKTKPSFNPYKLSMKHELMNSALGNTVYFAPKTTRVKKLSPVRPPRHSSIHVDVDSKLSAAGLQIDTPLDQSKGTFFGKKSHSLAPKGVSTTLT
jgi:hypothetical protein